MTRRLLLLGGGHSHLPVLAALAERRPPLLQVTLVSPHPRQLYSGMLPGHLAGHYREDEIAIPLLPLCEAAGVDFVEAAAVALDAGARQVTLGDGSVLAYDGLSLDVGGVLDRDLIPGAREFGLFLRPLEPLLRLWPRLIDLGRERDLRIVMVGGGAAGTEVAMALRQALPRSHITVVTGADTLMPGFPASARRHAGRALARRGIELLNDSVVRIADGHVALACGRELPCDAPVIATGTAAPPWLRDSGLALDDQGFVQTGPGLASISHPEVFASGDVATRQDISRPRSGVYAVRAGPALATNLLRAMQGEPPLPHCPGERSLVLIGCGDGCAIASWGEWAAQGRWLWRLKDRIDRRFVERYTRLARAAAKTGPSRAA